jgi:hypothetical protein
MSRAIHKPIAWILIAILAIVTGVGEGLHCIPGCGHGVEVGNRILLLGISLPEHKQSTDGRPGFERPDGQDIPVYDEDLCGICSAIGQSCTSADCVQFVLVMPLVHDLPAVVLCNAPAAAVRFFQARAPPLV